VRARRVNIAQSRRRRRGVRVVRIIINNRSLPASFPVLRVLRYTIITFMRVEPRARAQFENAVFRNRPPARGSPLFSIRA